MATSNTFWAPPDGTTGFEQGRASRYSWFWRLLWNTAYDDLSSYAALYPVGAKIYRYTRGLRNPIGRWVDFYVANVWGGTLDLEAGDGDDEPSALPIVTENERLRPAIAKVWQWSNWSSKRNLATMYSTALGDLFIKVVDRPAAGKCYMQVRWPGEITDLEWDDFGHVKLAEIEYQSEDARGAYTYKEVIEHPSVWGGRTTRFRTYRNGKLFAYDDNRNAAGTPVAEWTAPYDFVPVVHVPWQDVGHGWGAVGYVKPLRKIDAANALASQIADQVSKLVNTPLIAYGIQAGDVTATQSEDGVPVLYVNRTPQEAAITPMVSDLNIGDALAALKDQLDDITQDLPELRLSESLRSGMSGEALGRAFSDVLAQIQAVRAGHDSGLVRAQQMAIAIAGASGYAPEFAGFDLNSFSRGDLDHGIGSRPVLPRSTEEENAERERVWKLVKEAVAAGLPLETALREIAGWDDEQIMQMQAEQSAAQEQRASQESALLEAARREFNAGDGGRWPEGGGRRSEVGGQGAEEDELW